MKAAIKQQTLALLPIFINFALNNCSRSWVPNAVYFMTQPNHQPSATVAECGWMESCYQIGRFLLAIPSGILADKYGRKYMIVAIGIIQLLTWATLSVTHSVALFLVLRFVLDAQQLDWVGRKFETACTYSFLQGCAAAMSNATGCNSIGEISSPQYRGAFMVLYKSVGTLGLFIESFLAILSSSYWFMVYATTAITLLFFPSIPWIIESPYYLISVSKYEEAKRSLTKIRRGHSQTDIVEEYESLKQSVEYEQAIKSERTWIEYLRLKSTRQPLICCILLNTLVFANGSAVIFLYASVIFPPNEYVPNNFYPLILSVIQLVSSLSAICLIDAFPRRYLYMLSGFLSFLIQSFNGIAYYEYECAFEEDEQKFWKWMFLIGTAVYWVLSNAVISPLNGTIRTELFPLSIRGLGNSICLICQSVSAVLCYQIFNYVQQHFGVSLNYAIFAINSLLMMAVVYFLLPETRGKTLAEVQQSQHEKLAKEDKTTMTCIKINHHVEC